MLFQSTPSARRATSISSVTKHRRIIFQSTPSARRATEAYRSGTKRLCISIHALREESDLSVQDHGPDHPTISIHALREESDDGEKMHFQNITYFNPRPPRGERPGQLPQPLQGADFNPRPPRGERRKRVDYLYAACQFQSTPSARRATVLVRGVARRQPISIHALREESDAA